MSWTPRAAVPVPAAASKTVVFRRRTASTLVLVGLIGWTIVAAPFWWFAGVVLLFTAAGLGEFFALVRKKGWFVFPWLGMGVGLLIPLVTALGWGTHGATDATLLTVTCIVPWLMQLTRKNQAETLAAVSATLLGVIYVGWFMSYLIRLRLLAGGAGLVAFVILVTKIGDIGAYVIGSAVGNRPLIPRISPHKTVEGFAGGWAASWLAALAARPLLGPVPLVHAVVLGVVLGALAQAGDLAESLLKRDCQAKDSGQAIPGLGGSLDLLDSLLFTLPVYYGYVKVFL